MKTRIKNYTLNGIKYRKYINIDGPILYISIYKDNGSGGWMECKLISRNEYSC